MLLPCLKAYRLEGNHLCQVSWAIVFFNQMFFAPLFFTPQFNCKKTISEKIGRADDVDEVQCEEEDVSGKIIS